MNTGIHPFEQRGLGFAPFRFVGMSEKVHVAGDTVKPGGCCDYCHTGIRYCCHITSADGKAFVVGTDCVLKLGRADNQLTSAVQKEIARMEAEKREARRERKRAERQAKAAAELERQRAVNGGKTDAEVREEVRNAEASRMEEEVTAENIWLIEVLQQVPGNFAESMANDLRRRRLHTLSDRAIGILRDIYGRFHGRRGSKAYQAAIEAFEQRIESD